MRHAVSIKKIENTDAFLSVHDKMPGIYEASKEAIAALRDKHFTRTHISVVIKENGLASDRPFKSLEETVRRTFYRLINEGYIEMTGEKRYGRLLYRRAL